MVRPDRTCADPNHVLQRRGIHRRLQRAGDSKRYVFLNFDDVPSIAIVVLRPDVEAVRGSN